MKNLFIRTLSGIVFAGIMTGGLLGGTVPYCCLMLFLLVGLLSEFYELTLGKGLWRQKAIGITAGVAAWVTVFGLFSEQLPEWAVIATFLLTFACWIALPIQELYRNSRQPFAVIAHTVLGFVYIVVPLSLMNLVVHELDKNPVTYNGLPLLGLFIILWCSDVGAYVFGMLFGQHGRHKLFPSISPKKSWEGFVGGLLVAAAAGCVLSRLEVIPLSAVHSLIVALLMAVFGTFGDLVESMLKRSADVKDSGKIIPGHGGLLDRFDAALLALPVVCLYLFIVIYIFNLT
jgi:phosphatidate cytidylyltransferase